MIEEVCLIDYGVNNIQSVSNALSHLGYSSKVSSNPADILSARCLILPGVGSFKRAMESITALEIDFAIQEAVQIQKTKILGICLGMQLLSLSSTEDGFTTGLGLIPAIVEEFSNEAVQGQKIPHVGFNQVTCEDKSRLLKDLDKDSDFYFVHSFRLPVPPEGKGIFLECDYGEKFLAGYEHENIFATQFHPEKSQSNGLKLLANFLRA